VGKKHYRMKKGKFKGRSQFSGREPLYSMSGSSPF
jgi:hypothetical protein